MEEAEEKAEAKAETLVARFSDSFLDVSYTVHPCGIPGEQRGKGSNLCWAANSVLNSLAKPSLNIDNIIITVMDCKLCSQCRPDMSNLNPLRSRQPLGRRILQFGHRDAP